MASRSKADVRDVVSRLPESHRAVLTDIAEVARTTSGRATALLRDIQEALQISVGDLTKASVEVRSWGNDEYAAYWAEVLHWNGNGLSVGVGLIDDPDDWNYKPVLECAVAVRIRAAGKVGELLQAIYAEVTLLNAGLDESEKDASDLSPSKGQQ